MSADGYVGHGDHWTTKVDRNANGVKHRWTVMLDRVLKQAGNVCVMHGDRHVVSALGVEDEPRQGDRGNIVFIAAIQNLATGLVRSSL